MVSISEHVWDRPSTRLGTGMGSCTPPSFVVRNLAMKQLHQVLGNSAYARPDFKMLFAAQDSKHVDMNLDGWKQPEACIPQQLPLHARLYGWLHRRIGRKCFLCVVRASWVSWCHQAPVGASAACPVH